MTLRDEPGAAPRLEQAEGKRPALAGAGRGRGPAALVPLCRRRPTGERARGPHRDGPRVPHRQGPGDRAGRRAHPRPGRGDPGERRADARSGRGPAGGAPLPAGRRPPLHPPGGNPRGGPGSPVVRPRRRPGIALQPAGPADGHPARPRVRRAQGPVAGALRRARGSRVLRDRRRGRQAVRTHLRHPLHRVSPLPGGGAPGRGRAARRQQRGGGRGGGARPQDPGHQHGGHAPGGAPPGKRAGDRPRHRGHELLLSPVRHPSRPPARFRSPSMPTGARSTTSPIRSRATRGRSKTC